MEIKLPPLDGKETTIKGRKSIVLIGANGSGKTRMSIWIEYHNSEMNVHRISAQKSLNMPVSVQPSDMDKVKEIFLYGGTHENKTWLKHEGKKSQRWGRNPEIHLLNDFMQMMTLLVTEEYEKSLEYRAKHKSGYSSFDNITKLETIKTIWENIIPNKRLNIRPGKIEVSTDNADSGLYNGSEMSDGERAIFYFIGEVLCVLENSLIIIDEPENHLHKSILVRLWNAIESVRPDCVFLYITHDLAFANSRIDSQLIWVKNMPMKDKWEYELIDHQNNVINDIKLEIMGNRQNVLLVEGKDGKSLDKKLYAQLFPDYNVISVESCSKVMEYTKAYNRLKNLNYVTVKGIVDRDRRSDLEVSNLKDEHVFCPEVAEIENLFILPEVIKIVAERLSKGDDYERIFSSTKKCVFDFLKKELDSQSLLFIKQRIANEIQQKINATSTTVEEYKNNISSLSSVTSEIDKIYSEEKVIIQSIIDREWCYVKI